MEKGLSPFMPGRPIGSDLFTGRTQQLELVANYLEQAASGIQQNVFLIGDRGIGKSSFAWVTRQLALDRYKMIGVHVFLGGVDTVEELTRRVVQELLQVGKGQAWYNELRQLLGDHIKEVGLFSLKVAFQPRSDDLTQYARKFPEVLGDLVAKIIENGSEGVIIVLDDINGLAETPDFARWYKSITDEIATQFGSYPVMIMMNGIPERRDQLVQNEPSLMRVFRITELGRLSDDEVSEFYQRAFEQAGMTVSEEAMNTMVHFASGLPAMMHEMGEAVFWKDADGKIDMPDVIEGLAVTAVNVGLKYLEPSVFAALESTRYHSIIRKLGDSIEPTFTRQQIMDRLTNDERDVLDNLLRRLRRFGIIERDTEQGRGVYRYTNQIYPVYLYMQSQSQRGG